MFYGTGTVTVISLAKGTSSVLSRKKSLKVNQMKRTRRLMSLLGDHPFKESTGVNVSFVRLTRKKSP